MSKPDLLVIFNLFLYVRDVRESQTYPVCSSATVVYILNTLLNCTVMLQLVLIADKLILQSEGKSGFSPWCERSKNKPINK